MQEAVGIVIFGVVIVASLVAVATLASSRSDFDQVGANGLGHGSDRPAYEPLSGAGFAAVRDEEARQMLQARRARRVRRGEERSTWSASWPGGSARRPQAPTPSCGRRCASS